MSEKIWGFLPIFLLGLSKLNSTSSAERFEEKEKKSLAGLSKLHSTCPKENFEEFFCEIYIFPIIFGH